MAREGYVLEKVSFMKYVFKKTDPVDLVYDFDFQILNKISEPEYLDLFRDWNFVGKFGSWYYFSKIREGKSKDKIYNDKKSKGEMIKNQKAR